MEAEKLWNKAIWKAKDDGKNDIYEDFGSTEKSKNRTYVRIHILISYEKKNWKYKRKVLMKWI